MKTFCRYCGKEHYGTYCSPQCEHLYNEYVELVERNKVRFLTGMLLPWLLLFSPIFFGHISLFAGITVAIVGIVLRSMPYCTQETIDSMGVVPSMRFGRRAGAAFVVVGLVFIVIDILVTMM